jgi:hypothetical protein
VLLVAGCAVVLLCGLGNPLGGGRSFIAFSQHYAVNVVTTEQLAFDHSSRDDALVARDFGDAATVRQAWQANPRAFLWHFGLNARRTPAMIAHLVQPRLDLARKASHLWACGVVVAAVLGVVGLVRRAGTGKQRRGLILGPVMLGLLLVSTLPSVLVIAPREHYLLSVVVFLIALLGAGLGGLPRLRLVWERLERPWALVGLFVVLLAVTPNRAHGWNVQALLGRQPPASRRLVDQEVVAALRRLPLRQPTVILGAVEPGRGIFANMPGYGVPPTAKAGGFWDFVERAGVGVIVVDSLLENAASFRDDPEFQAFAAARQAGGFTFVAVPGLPVRIAVRKALLAGPLETDHVLRTASSATTAPAD